MKCPHCTEEMALQLELLSRIQDRGAAPGNKIATYVCNTCARMFRVHESKEGATNESTRPPR